MSVGDLLSDLWLIGVHPLPTTDRMGLRVPVNLLTDRQRQILLRHKHEVLEVLTSPEADALMEAAMHACDVWGDSATERLQMKIDIWNTPANLHHDLRQYFLEEYGESEPQN